MPRRVDSPEAAAARDKLKARLDRLQVATDAFFEASARSERLREQLDRVEHEQRRHAAEVAVISDPATAADLLGWPIAQIRSAVAEQRQQRAALRSSAASSVESGGGEAR